jgi:cytochrome P450
MPPRPDLSGFMMNAGFMLTPTRFLDACHRRCGDYFTLRPTPDREVVFTVDPAAVEKVFKGDPNLLYAGEGNVSLAPILGPGSVLLLDGPEHLRHRRLLLPPFHGERMRNYGAVMKEVADRHVAAWPRGERFAVLPSMQSVTLEVIMRAVFGFEDRERRERIGDPLRRLLDTVGSRPRVLAMALTAGRNGRLSPWRRFAAIRRQADDLLREEIRARRSDPHGDEGDDIFSMLLAARDPDGEPLSDGELRDELMTLLVAGHETTATALSWTLERLIRSPQVLARLLAEERQGRDDYLDAVIKESLRLRPVVPAVVRRLQAPMEFGGWELPAGANIAPSIYLLHRRPDIYPEPLEFRPERFLGDGVPGTYEWIPFGGGVRRCLGASFALFEMKVVLRSVLGQVRLSADPGLRPESVTRRAITFAPARGGRLVAEPI